MALSFRKLIIGFNYVLRTYIIGKVKNHETQMRVKANISVKKGEGYIFRLHDLEPEGFPKKFKVNFEEFNYYDGEDDR